MLRIQNLPGIMTTPTRRNKMIITQIVWTTFTLVFIWSIAIATIYMT